jgi:hypothetical protein
MTAPLKIADTHHNPHRPARHDRVVATGAKEVYDLTHAPDLAEYQLVLSYTRTA